MGRITIDARPVFDASEEGAFYRAVNRLHVQTRAALIRRFLLFHEGDPYDPSTLVETERNLRLFDFLQSVSITAGAPRDGVVDITVVTTDAFTTSVTGDFSNEGGIDVFNADVTQQDLFGTGAALELLTDHAVERTRNAVELRHPAIFGPYWNLDALYAHNSDGGEESLAIVHQNGSYGAPPFASVIASHLVRDERIYRDGEVASLFHQRHRALTLSRLFTTHIVAGIDFLDDEFCPGSAAACRRPGIAAACCRETNGASKLAQSGGGSKLPHSVDDRHFHFADAGYESAAFEPLKLDYIDHDSREEDINLGRVLSLHGAVSPSAWRMQAAAADGFAFSRRSFLLARISATARGRMMVASADVRTIARFGSLHPQAFVTRVRIDLGSHLDRDTQFFADGQNGLRAYPDFAFEGSRRIIVNAEDRLYLGRELLGLFSPSVAAFADSGQAGFHHLKTDAGIGLRIGIARYDQALIRVDYARAFNSSPLSRRGNVLSISTSHAF